MPRTILTRLEPNYIINLKRLPFYRAELSSKLREELINVAINKADKGINERISALFELRGRLEKLPDNSPQKLLTNREVQALHYLITDEAEFPIMVYPDEFTVEEITHEKEREDSTYKLKIIRAIKENDAVLRAQAALLIVDFGQVSKKYKELKHRLVAAITTILGNMVAEPDHLFLPETGTAAKVEPIPSIHFKNFVEALYFIDEKAGGHFIKIFNLNIDDFSLDRRNRKAIAS